MDDASAPKGGRLDFLSAKLSNGLNKATEAATQVAGTTKRVAEKAVETLKDEKVQTAIALGVVVVGAMTKARASEGGLAKKGFDFLSGVMSGISQVKPKMDEGVSPTEPPTDSPARDEKAGFDFGDTAKPAPTRTDIFPTPQDPETMVLGTQGTRGDTANAAGYCFTLSIDNLQNMQFLVGVQPSLKWPYEVGGAYELTFLDAQVLHQLLDKRGPKLPIAVRRLDSFSVQVLIDGALPEDLPGVKTLPGY